MRSEKPRVFFPLIKMWFLRTVEKLSVGFNSPVKCSPFVLSHHFPDRFILFSAALFSTQGRFLRLEL